MRIGRVDVSKHGLMKKKNWLWLLISGRCGLVIDWCLILILGANEREFQVPLSDVLTFFIFSNSNIQHWTLFSPSKTKRDKFFNRSMLEGFIA